MVFQSTLLKGLTRFYGLFKPFHSLKKRVYMNFSKGQISIYIILSMAILLIAYSLISHAGIFDSLTVINLFFALVMLIEPMTSPLSGLQGWLFGVIVAIAGFIFYLYFPQYDFALSGLMAGNLSNIFLRRLKKR